MKSKKPQNWREIFDGFFEFLDYILDKLDHSLDKHLPRVHKFILQVALLLLLGQHVLDIFGGTQEPDLPPYTDPVIYSKPPPKSGLSQINNPAQQAGACLSPSMVIDGG